MECLLRAKNTRATAARRDQGNRRQYGSRGSAQARGTRTEG